MNKIVLLGLVFLCTPCFVLAETLTTDNLIVNGTFESGNSNGWTTNGDVQVLNDCCGSNYDLEFGDSGSIEQSFNLTSDTISQSMLNNGIQLDSSILIQNGEGGPSPAWSSNGGADTFTIRLQIRNSDNEVLATTNNIRTTTTGINGEAFSDQVIYNGSGSNIGNLFISGSDANAPATLGGPNVDNIAIFLTYDNTVMTATQSAALTETVQELNEVIELFEEIIPEKILTEEFVIQEFEPIALEIIEESFTELTLAEQFVEEELILAVVETEPEIVELVEPEPIEIAEEIQTIEEEIYAEVTPQEETEIAQQEEINNEEVTEQSGTIREESGTTGTGNESVTETTSTETNTISGIDKIAAKVASKIQDLDKRLQVTQIIIAKVIMGKNNNIINTYSKFGNEIFDNQLEITEMSLTTAYLKEIEKDNRVIASPVLIEYQEKLNQANDDVIRAEENLRRIKLGY
ncbi:putative carbohydrate binding domain containing protein [uncultured phage_MedDCM-OCT-S28-C10]|uniref:Putative carbohydrate binding domain containing protein n=1 Tax=uncultured phage_MedDCM-OCT-S28-C10 TaxID=2741077 RepID=A0A6S4PCK8_9CAUD|nr:putative carbohydrate binding domain containing protein [uncultured phage_MedDCM-OCT-S28-C10]BAQ94057.1 putative carbohydrate binding domain containing protein [uncultured phage_MedDCM-OCT-S28-C10]